VEGVLFRETLRDVLKELTPRQGYVFLHRALEGEDYAQIASTLGGSPGAVRVLYCTACRRLRQRWPEILGEDL
jgi:RNA polymerase sigma factor (sigma-70 family)